MGDQRHQQNAGRREVGVAALPMPSDGRNPRPIISRAYSRKEDEPTAESDVPPVPALVRGASTESSCNEFSDASDDRRRTVRKSTNGEDAKQRPLSTASRKYVPKSAAKGFLQSTNGASDEARESFRQSFHLEDQADMVCLTDEQRLEWAKLMERETKLEDPFESTEDDKNHKFSNSQALAALEFGIR
ncbi:uncharacterized protein MYCFIDRAFT_76297 [Pseudocercospora fijiensis CIRAD86]|uniref:Uncharacterized protein n=1 Tax=Pseudocercospora fijiensis (strain CIRAD86) TaxID=383855 RepID=N1Q801_PSEFD|nr:uncharacterized protein MYCFIDRAFT_76297 [Pseudocercospora fijiensis CIRAD86]EME88914.1 hypothetical protein MYCFIDRAFT_76297 [Pseudocercospora fijiensis CIRAD86]